MKRLVSWADRAKLLFSQWMAKPKEDVTIVLLTKGDRDVRKIRVTVEQLRWIKTLSLVCAGIAVMTFSFFVFFILDYPQRRVIQSENTALREEMNKLHAHLDLFQMSMDRMQRFDQKLRTLTNTESKSSAPDDSEISPTTADFGDFQVDLTKIDVSEDSKNYLDRSDLFVVQKLTSWVRKLFWRGALQEQSLEELYEVLKGREIELAFTPSVIPVRGFVTSHFGYRIDPFTSRRALHKGMDISARHGATVASPAEGTVTFVGSYGAYGNAIMVFHGFGVTTLYAHLDTIKVNLGQKVRRGELIGTVGTSGRSTAPHLHYEVILHGVSVDPRRYVLDRVL